MTLMLPSSPSRMAPDRLVATIVDVASTACCERDEGEGRGVRKKWWFWLFGEEGKGEY